MTLRQIAEVAGLNKATARRFLLTLADLGYVAQDDGLFRLTPKVLTLGTRYLDSLDIPQLALPALEALLDTAGVISRRLGYEDTR